jgi:DNA-directed RNA polymerase specialized sigma24 family protein
MTAASVAMLAAQIDPLEIDCAEWSWNDGANPDLWLYRDRTVALLKRYMRLSVEVGRLPSLLGREFFRTRVTSYHVATFEDTVIFVHDVERMLGRLDPFSQKLIAKIVLQEYTQDEAARLLGCWRRTVGRRFPEALDRLSEMFLEGGLLRPFDEPEPMAPETCQEAEIEENPASDWIEGE